MWKNILFILLVVYILSKSVQMKKFLMYGRDSCPHCVNMKEQLTKDGVMQDFQFIDVQSRSGERMFSKTNADGVPFFINPINNASASGSMNTKELYNRMNMKEGPFVSEFDMTGVVMFGSYDCGYTVKMIDELKRNDVWEQITFIDTESIEGRALYKRTSASGVPHMLHPNGKTVTGYVSYDALVKKLTA